MNACAIVKLLEPYDDNIERPARNETRAELRLFGRVALITPDAKEVPLSSRRARGLLAFAALQRDGQASRTRVAGLFWGDRAETQARASLRQALTELKSAIAAAWSVEVLEATRDNIRLRLERLSVDVLELERAIDDGAVEALAAMLAHIGSEPLCDEPAFGDLHQDWLDETRAHIEAKLASGVHKLLGRLTVADPAAARALAESFLRRQPLDEVATAAVMRADVALGAATAAVIRFAAFKRALARDLNVAPGQIVQAALTAALEGSMAAPAKLAVPVSASVGLGDLATVPTVLVAAFAEDAAAGGWGGILREEILGGLSRFRELSVVAEPWTAERVPRELWSSRQDVYLLSGTTQAREGGVRLTVQLLHLADNAVVWSDRGALAPGAAEDVIDRLVGRIVGAVVPTIQADLVPRLVRGAKGGYGAFLLTREKAMRASTFAQARAAADSLELLIAKEPDISHAYLALARLYNTDFGFTRAGSSGVDERRRAFELAKAALALDRGHAHGYTVMGWCYLWRRDWVVARRHFEQAVDLNPFSADRLMEVGFGSLFLGDLDHARELLERCLQLNPTPKDGFFMDLGLLEMIRGRHDLAQAHFDMVASPTVPDALYGAANAAMAGTPDEERSARARARLAAIWPPDTSMQPEAVAAWFLSSHPFRDASVAQRVSEGVRHVFASKDGEL